MIGQADWFQRRKYGGWGLTPKTWQGWVYVLGFIGLVLFMKTLPISIEIQRNLTYGVIGLFVLDILHIMTTLKKEEMEVKIEAFAERNAAWAMIFVIIIGVIYQAFQTAITGHVQLDWFLIAALIGGVIAKAITNIWLQHKGV